MCTKSLSFEDIHQNLPSSLLASLPPSLIPFSLNTATPLCFTMEWPQSIYSCSSRVPATADLLQGRKGGEITPRKPTNRSEEKLLQHENDERTCWWWYRAQIKTGRPISREVGPDLKLHLHQSKMPDLHRVNVSHSKSVRRRSSKLTAQHHTA